MVEWYMYVLGLNKKIGGQKYWRGDGIFEYINGCENVRIVIK